MTPVTPDETSAPWVRREGALGGIRVLDLTRILAGVRAAKASISAFTTAGRRAPRSQAAEHAVDFAEFTARIAAFLSRKPAARSC